MSPLVATVSVLLLLVKQVWSDLPASRTQLNERLQDALMPNERESLDDCHFRYYNLGGGNAVAPAFGSPAFLREFAHIAAIGWSQKDGNVRWDCGGSLIWENFVLTAAHCVADQDNIAPDVVRLGDIDLYNDTDDAFAQQYKILEIIRHPDHRFIAKYHDVALLKLEQYVTLNETVAPACLWTEDEVRFPVLQAAGWGATGFGQAQTPSLLKVSLRPVEKEQCNRHYQVGDRGLKDGLKADQMCAGDIKMDTCPGDSGGPLEVKLLHNTKVTPFIVAITSFGTACGQSLPGVYTKISSYIPWIRSVLEAHGEEAPEWKFRPYACALRYVTLREYEPDVVASKTNFSESVNLEYVHVQLAEPTSTVVLGWDSVTESADNCHGVLIDEDTVITLAQCTSFKGKPPTYVTVTASGNDQYDISSISIHPDYRNGSLYNNIAIIKLNEPLNFHKYLLPACLWPHYALPDDRFEILGRGRRDLNELYLYQTPTINAVSKSLISRADLHQRDNCTLPSVYSARLPVGLSEEHLCFGNAPFLVPETCELMYGGAVQRNVFRLQKYFKHLFGLSMLGRDCGYGQSAIAVRIASHMEWLSKVLLTNRPHEAANAVRFYNSDLTPGDHCQLPFGAGSGQCTEVAHCPKVRYDIQLERQVSFCSNASVVCCPMHHIRNVTHKQSSSAARNELDDCETRYKSVHRKTYLFYEIRDDRDNDETERDQYPHVVSKLPVLRSHNRTLDVTSLDNMSLQVIVIWRADDGTAYECVGTLITQSAILSTGECLSLIGTNQAVVVLGFNSTSTTIPVQEVIIHPQYDASTLRNDIGLIKIRGKVEPTTGKVPACLWHNQTHTPFRLKQFMQAEMQYLNSYPMYNKYCERYNHYGNRSLEPTQLCLSLESVNNPIAPGEPAFWQNELDDEAGYVVQYLVGLVSYVFPMMTVHTRIESYVDWIKSVL
ncbi:uncharacterized protein LOC118459650 [Anopheles albimanus]|uniref:uncharacterized protein LOC118459650 n=1 Tax=Anopheles albimanus TaxID=7167 RepID=UPI00163ECEE6|nr:uncharacterized protein LOC118459650 [Anopheles albimanus]